MGIPLAPEASVPLAPHGDRRRASLELLAIAGGEGSAATVVSFLRRPGPRPARAASTGSSGTVRRERMETADEALDGVGRRLRGAAPDLVARRRSCDAGDDPAAIARVL